MRYIAKIITERSINPESIGEQLPVERAGTDTGAETDGVTKWQVNAVYTAAIPPCVSFAAT